MIPKKETLSKAGADFKMLCRTGKRKTREQDEERERHRAVPAQKFLMSARAVDAMIYRVYQFSLKKVPDPFF